MGPSAMTRMKAAGNDAHRDEDERRDEDGGAGAHEPEVTKERARKAGDESRQHDQHHERASGPGKKTKQASMRAGGVGTNAPSAERTQLARWSEF